MVGIQHCDSRFHDSNHTGSLFQDSLCFAAFLEGHVAYPQMYRLRQPEYELHFQMRIWNSWALLRFSSTWCLTRDTSSCALAMSMYVTCSLILNPFVINVLLLSASMLSAVENEVKNPATKWHLCVFPGSAKEILSRKVTKSLWRCKKLARAIIRGVHRSPVHPPSIRHWLTLTLTRIRLILNESSWGDCG